MACMATVTPLAVERVLTEPLTVTYQHCPSFWNLLALPCGVWQLILAIPEISFPY